MSGRDTFSLSTKRLRHVSSLCALFLGVCLVLLVTRARHNHASKAHTLGRFTTARILEVSDPILAAIAPDRSSLQVYAAPLAGGVHNWWMVACKDNTGRYVANLTWNADTGELMLVGATPQLNASPTPLLNSREAVASAFSWLETLGLARTTRWHVARQPHCRDGQSWSVLCQGGGRLALFQMEAHSGNLLGAYFWHPRAHPRDFVRS